MKQKNNSSPGTDLWRIFLRRLIQSVFLGLFFVLFFYVACPYPAEPTQKLSDWTPLEVDSENGTVCIENPTSSNTNAAWLQSGKSVYLSDSTLTPPVSFGRFEIVRKQDKTLELKPLEPLAPETVDELSTNFGPWTLHETDPGTWSNHYETFRQSKSFMPPEWFLYLDPMVGVTAILSSVVAGTGPDAGPRTYPSWIIFCGLIVFLSSFVLRRCFCSYICPLGTIFDSVAGLRKFYTRNNRPNTQYEESANRSVWRWGVFAVALVSAPMGIALAGFVTPIPILVRGMTAIGTPLQTVWYRGWHSVPPLGSGQVLAATLLIALVIVSAIWPRLWCRCFCPTGTLLSLPRKTLFGIKIDEEKCTKCKNCRSACDFHALDKSIQCKDSACTSCLACIDICRTGAISLRPRKPITLTIAQNTFFHGKHGEHGKEGEVKEKNPCLLCFPWIKNGVWERRRVLLCGLGGFMAGTGLASVMMLRKQSPAVPLRPPGALPEQQFIASCVRCGQCLQVCPNNALQPMNIDTGLDRLWTPRLVPDWSGCEPSCNNCGNVCPTGAIQPLSMADKRKFVIGLAVIDTERCLPYAGREECRLCVDECTLAGYNALEFVRHGTEVDDEGQPIEDSGFLAPKLLPEKCVGCGLCQNRCRMINAKQKGLLKGAAIKVFCGILDFRL